VWQIAGLTVIGGALAVVPAFVIPADYGNLSAKGLAIVWITQLVYAFSQVAFDGSDPPAVKTEP